MEPFSCISTSSREHMFPTIPKYLTVHSTKCWWSWQSKYPKMILLRSAQLKCRPCKAPVHKKGKHISLSCEYFSDNTKYSALYLRNPSFYSYHEWFWFMIDSLSQWQSTKTNSCFCLRYSDNDSIPLHIKVLQPPHPHKLQTRSINLLEYSNQPLHARMQLSFLI